VPCEQRGEIAARDGASERLGAAFESSQELVVRVLEDVVEDESAPGTAAGDDRQRALDGSWREVHEEADREGEGAGFGIETGREQSRVEVVMLEVGLDV
jgi:hypothetical protein